jgi:hypothetical protein
MERSARLWWKERELSASLRLEIQYQAHHCKIQC